MEGGGLPSFKSMLTNGMSAAKNEEDYESDEFDLNEGDIITSVVDGMPDIRFFERVHTLVQRSMTKLMVIKMLGRKIRFHDYYIMKFQAKRDYEKALTEGSWVVVWIRPPCFLSAWYKRYLLEAVGNSIGQVARMDDNIENGYQERFTRLAISVDLRQPLISKLRIRVTIGQSKNSHSFKLVTRSYAKAHNNLVSKPSVMGDKETLAAKLDAFMAQITTGQQALKEQMAVFSFGPKDSKRPPMSNNPLGELANLRQTRTVEEYQHQFQSLLAKTVNLKPRQQ
ncbi:hypothetical protein Golax_004537, partial [Gossypium laxum]|nr:hypothetical protein [Gossypium laxum]